MTAPHRHARHPLAHCTALLAGLAVCQGAVAQPATATPTAGSTLEPIVVTGSVSELRVFDAPYAIGVVDREMLGSAGPRVNLSEALAAVPGLAVLNRHNYAQDLQISSRGFGARASFGVRGLRLYTDGIPATMPDGSGQVTHFDLAGAQRIEVLRGPFSALYGNSSGGVISLVSAPVKERRASIDVDAGSHGMRQVRGSYEAPLGEHWELRAGLSAFTTDGFRPHSGAQRLLGNLRLGWRDGPDTVTVHANAMQQDADDPLGLTRAQFDDDPYQTTPQAREFDTRKRADQQQLGVQWKRRHEGSALSETTLMAYTGQRSVKQWQSIPVGAQGSPAHSGGVIDLERRYHGADARAVWRFGRGQWVLGVSHERQDDRRRGHENFTGSGATQQLGVTGALRRDETNTAHTTDVYTQAEFDVTERLVATLGVRSGRVKLRSDDRYLTNGDDSGARSFRYTNPVAGLLWRTTPQLNLYASVGRGYESPTLNELAYRSDGSSGFNGELEAQTSRQIELGAKWRAPDGNTSVDFAVFHARTDDEIAVQRNTGGRATYTNVGSTRRQGAELSALWRLAPTVKTRVALTWLDATYRDGFLACTGTPCLAPDTPVDAGNRIAGTTPRSAFVDLAWQPAAGRELALEWRAQARTAVNDVNSDFAGGYGVLALRARARFGGEQGPQVYLRVDNLLGRRHAGSVIVNEGNGRYFEPGAPRTWAAGLSWPL